MKETNKGIMMMGGEATPENLRRAKRIIEELLGESGCNSMDCGECNCTKMAKQMIDTINAKQKAKKDAVGKVIALQLNALLDLAAENGIVVPLDTVKYNSIFEEIVS